MMIDMCVGARIRGYSADDWNINGWCYANVWTEVFRLLCTDYNPFDRDELYDWNKRVKIWMYPLSVIGEMPEEIEYRAKIKQRYFHKNADNKDVGVGDKGPPEKKRRKRGM